MSIYHLILFLALPVPLHAQLGSRPAEDWIKTLESSHRVERLKIDDTVAALGLKPGDRVVDIGAGSGLFCPALAKAVAPGGKVYAVEIEQGLIDYIAERASQLNLTNIQPVLGQFTDPALPVHDLDLAFIFDVLHHIDQREAYLKNLVRYLKPTGRIAIADFHPELGPHRDDPTMQVAKEQTHAWMAALGYKPAKTISLYDDKWFVIYARAD
jgi:ubiquinone/menaquinone biosynthesis C-methylase UbiE